MELTALLLPLMVGLEFLLLSIFVAQASDFVKCCFALSFRGFSYLDKFLDFTSDGSTLLIHCTLDARDLIFDLILDVGHTIPDGHLVVFLLS